MIEIRREHCEQHNNDFMLLGSINNNLSNIEMFKCYLPSLNTLALSFYPLRYLSQGASIYCFDIVECCTHWTEDKKNVHYKYAIIVRVFDQYDTAFGRKVCKYLHYLFAVQVSLEVLVISQILINFYLRQILLYGLGVLSL